MKITDENRRVVASYLADYLLLEKERILIPESEWTHVDITNWVDSGLEAYESINQPKQYAIAPVNRGDGRHLNGQQFLLSDNKKVKLFDSIAEAKKEAESLGLICDVCEYLPESGDYVVVA